MTAPTGQKPGQDCVHRPQDHGRPNPANLSECYGAIGIASVAAAARYAGSPKADAPVAPRIDQRFEEETAA